MTPFYIHVIVTDIPYVLDGDNVQYVSTETRLCLHLGYPNKDIWSYLFVLTSLLLSWRLNDGRGKQSFELQLKQLIKSISNMMLYTSDNTLVAQVRGPHLCLPESHWCLCLHLCLPVSFWCLCVLTNVSWVSMSSSVFTSGSSVFVFIPVELCFNMQFDFFLQGSALKYMCATIPDILKVFDAVELR